jgi:hypothetical protein
VQTPAPATLPGREVPPLKLPRASDLAPERPPPEPCRAPTGSVEPPGCVPLPGATPDPSQPATKRASGLPALEEHVGWVGWAESGHGAMEEGLTSIIERVDGFFGDPSHIQFDPPSLRSRVRFGVRLGQDTLIRPEASVLADARLPSLEHALSRARLFIVGGNDEDRFQTGTTDQELVPPNSLAPSLAAARGAVELRFDLWRIPRTVVDLGGGVRFRVPPTPYVRLRGARVEELGLGLVGSLNQTLFWERFLGFGESTRADLARVLGPRTVARAWGIGTLHEESRGLEWSSELGFAQGLDRLTGLYLAAAAEGATRPRSQVDRYRAYTRLRRDVHQAWVFAEVEPEVSWPLRVDGTRPRVLAVTFRLEVQFATMQP